MSGGRYWVKRLDELPLVPTDDPNDFDWYPVQHHLGLGAFGVNGFGGDTCLLYTSPSPRDRTRSRMPSSA